MIVKQREQKDVLEWQHNMSALFMWFIWLFDDENESPICYAVTHSINVYMVNTHVWHISVTSSVVFLLRLINTNHIIQFNISLYSTNGPYR